jgi:uncharacterized protein (DUF433 family)
VKRRVSIAAVTTDAPRAIGYYTAADVARLAGVTPHRVGRWAREGIILPSVSSSRPHVYSYADAGEAILAHYLVEQGKRPGDVREIVHLLRDQYGQWPLATAPLAHDGRLLVARDEQRGTWVSLDRPQHDVMDATLLNLKDIREALKHGGWVAYKTPREHIEVDPDRRSGEPVVRGKRVTTAFVADLARTADGVSTLQDDYDLTPDEINDAIGYETDLASLVA